ncbi:MAG: tetratricopeptide repeat protein [Mariprofundaceae bacterium]
MIRLVIISGLLSAVLLACAPMHSIKSDARIIQPVPASEMDETFLFMSAFESMHSGSPDLAIRFLTTLLEKDAQAWTPRLLLAELLISRKDFSAALEHLQTVLGDPDAPEERRFEALGLRSRINYFNGNKQEALDDLESILAYRPAIFSIRMQHIELLENMGRMDEAHASIAEALQQRPSTHLYKIDAQLYLKQGQLEQANEALSQARALNPGDESLLLMQSELAMRRNLVGQAETMLHAFIKANPMALQAGNALGRLLIAQQRFDEAVAIYEQLAEKTHQHSEVVTALGLLHYQQQDYARAAVYFRQALDKKPNDSLRFYLAVSLENTDQPNEAEKLYAAIDTSSKDYASAQLRLAVLEFENDQVDQAAKRLKQLLSQQHGLIDAHIMLASIRLRQKNYALLIKESEPALALEPMATRLLFHRAIAFENMKQFDSLESSLYRLLVIEPENAEALNFLGYSLADRNVRLDEAERLIRTALEHSASSGYYLDSLGWVLYRQGKFEQALEIQRRAVAVIADDPIMHEHLGDMLWRSGRPDQARQAWQQAIDLEHETPDALRRKISGGLQDQ